ncbi:MAG: GTP-binding protein [Dehalococcoidia bacterium]
MDSKFIPRCCIRAHIHSGKSTLAGRFLEYTGAIGPREMKEQLPGDFPSGGDI